MPSPTFPDICLTPSAPTPTPVPYPNLAMHGAAMPVSPEIMLTHSPAMNMMSPFTAVQSMLPDPHPSVAGAGISPGPGVMTSCLPNLPSSFGPPAAAGGAMGAMGIPNIASIMFSMLPGNGFGL